MLFGCNADELVREFTGSELCGFYWTEGLRGLGWAVDAVPTLKGGSTIGIPSPPALWDPHDHSVTTPDIRDAERLQGFDANWTAPAVKGDGVRAGHRWKLVGNAVSVPLGKWIGERIAAPTGHVPEGILLKRGMPWPYAAWGHHEDVFSVDVSTWPVRQRATSLRNYLRFPRVPLSYRAAAGFFSRADKSSLNMRPEFLRDVRLHVEWMREGTLPSDASKTA